MKILTLVQRGCVQSLRFHSERITFGSLCRVDGSRCKTNRAEITCQIPSKRWQACLTLPGLYSRALLLPSCSSLLSPSALKPASHGRSLSLASGDVVMIIQRCNQLHNEAPQTGRRICLACVRRRVGAIEQSRLDRTLQIAPNSTNRGCTGLATRIRSLNPEAPNPKH